MYTSGMIRILNRILISLAFAVPLFVTAVNVFILDAPAKDLAVLKMMFGLIILWILVCGTLMRVFKRPLLSLMRRLPGGWQMQFVLASILLACVEEAITTAMTNLAPVFGSSNAEGAFITASTNYIEVITLHSVVVFVPMIITWGWLLKRYAFTPSHAFLLFGLLGTVLEAMYSSPQELLNVGLWSSIYGLMVWLPAHLAPPDRQARRVRFWHYPLTIILPIIAALPVVILVHALFDPPRTHFSDVMNHLIPWVPDGE